MPSSEWFYVQDRQKVGPVSKEQLRSLYDQGTISGEDLVWTQGMSEWKPASQVQARFAAPAAAQSAPPASPPPMAEANMDPAIDMAAAPPDENAVPEPTAAYEVGEGLGIDRAYAPTTEHEYAHFGLRLGAFIIDSIIVFVLNCIVMTGGFAVIFLVVSMFQGSDAGNAFATFLMLIMYGLMVAVPWLYYARQESGMKMATIGKRAVGIQVIDMDGYPISFLRATGRHFGKVLSGMFCAFGYFMALFTEKKQTLHDMLAACVVVKAS
jgi:uncharacterized RDD family membrane protein YckC